MPLKARVLLIEIATAFFDGEAHLWIIPQLGDTGAKPLPHWQLVEVLLGVIGAAVIGVVMRRAELPAGVHPFDVPTYLAVAGLIVASTAAAALWPTRRALRIEPQEALRTD